MPSAPTIQTDSPAQSPTADKKLTCRTILKQGIHLYRNDFRFLTTLFLTPAIARCLWTVAQFAFTRYRHPDWPVAGVLINSDWGLSLYWYSIVLTWGGWFLYGILMGPGLAAASRGALNLVLLGSDSSTSAPAVRTFLRSVRIQFSCVLRAWSVFILGLLATLFVGATLLASNTDAALLLWYALIVLSFGAGLPIGIRLSLRYALTVPAAVNEKFHLVDAIARSSQMTRGSGLPLLRALSSILFARLALGIASACALGLLSQSLPAAAPGATFVLLPLARCALDAISGPLLGATLASFYAQKAASELNAVPQIS